MESKLCLKTQEYLKTRPRQMRFKDVSEATGIPEAWLKMFGAGKIKEPSCPRVEKVYEFLTGKELAL